MKREVNLGVYGLVMVEVEDYHRSIKKALDDLGFPKYGGERTKARKLATSDLVERKKPGRKKGTENKFKFINQEDY